MHNTAPQKTYIGIDSGATTGVSIWDGSFLNLDSGTFWDVIYMLDTLIFDKLKPLGAPYEIHIEDPNLNKITFRRNGNMKTDDRKAQNVGMNKRDAQLLIEWCEFHKLPYKRRKPLRKKNADGSAKWLGKDGKITAEEFNRITLYNKQTNQHERDATLLILPYIMDDCKKKNTKQ